jgi:hypothetical protein
MMTHLAGYCFAFLLVKDPGKYCLKKYFNHFLQQNQRAGDRVESVVAP